MPSRTAGFAGHGHPVRGDGAPFCQPPRGRARRDAPRDSSRDHGGSYPGLRRWDRPRLARRSAALCAYALLLTQDQQRHRLPASRQGRRRDGHRCGPCNGMGDTGLRAQLVRGRRAGRHHRRRDRGCPPFGDRARGSRRVGRAVCRQAGGRLVFGTCAGRERRRR